MPIVLDLIVLIFLGYNAYLGYKKGFIDVAINFLGIFLIIFLVWLLSFPISNIVLKTDMAKNMEAKLEAKVEEIAGEDGNKISEQKKNDDLNASEVSFLDLIVKFKAKENSENSNLRFSEYVAKNLTRIIIKTIVSIFLFIAFSIGLKLINKILTSAMNTFTVSSMLNNIGGLALGSVKALILIYLILFAIRLISPIVPLKKVNEGIKESIITKNIYKGDFLLNKIIGVKK